MKKATLIFEQPNIFVEIHILSSLSSIENSFSSEGKFDGQYCRVELEIPDALVSRLHSVDRWLKDK